MEACTYLEQSNKFFIVLHCPDYEQILLYDLASGKRERIKVTFKNQLDYCDVLEEDHVLYIAFDKKVVALDMDNGQQADIWHADAGETFFDFKVNNGTIYLLLQWVMTCRMPIYRVFIPNSEGVYEQGRTSPVLYITEKDSENMLMEKDVEFFVQDPVKNRDVITARGMFLHPSVELRQNDPSFETLPEESTRVFFYVEDYGKYIENIIGDSTFVMQNDRMYLTTLKSYSEVCVYHKD